AAAALDAHAKPEGRLSGLRELELRVTDGFRGEGDAGVRVDGDLGVVWFHGPFRTDNAPPGGWLPPEAGMPSAAQRTRRLSSAAPRVSAATSMSSGVLKRPTQSRSVSLASCGERPSASAMRRVSFPVAQDEPVDAQT